jgi:adenylylsulfate kinase
MTYSESHARSIAKAVSWRVLGTFTTALLVYIFTRRVALSLTVGALEFTSKIALFWLHERVWDRVGLGRRGRHPPV